MSGGFKLSFSSNKKKKAFHRSLYQSREITVCSIIISETHHLI